MSFKDIVPEPSTVTRFSHSFTKNNHNEYNRNHNIIDWFTWRMEHWGCIHDATNQELLENGISFWTAWAPPTEVIDEIWDRCQKIYPSLHMKFGYYECGNLICGTFEDGIWNHENLHSCDDCGNCEHYIPYDPPGETSKVAI